MGKSIKTEIVINASREKVWEVLTDFKKYPDWNPFIRSISNELKEGGRLKILLQNGENQMAFKPKILQVQSGRSFDWMGSLFIKGLFDGHHYFEIEELSPNQVLFRHGEDFSGILSNMILKKVGERTRNGFVRMNEELKKRAEN
jgi:hypothetical protein